MKSKNYSKKENSENNLDYSENNLLKSSFKTGKESNSNILDSKKKESVKSLYSKNPKNRKRKKVNVHQILFNH